jgi:ribose transport system ATP-binding protein
LARVLIGEDNPDAGTVWLRGKAVHISNVGEAISRHRLGYVTENRKEEGLFLHDSVENNLTLAVLKKLINPWTRCIRSAATTDLAGRLADSLQIKTPSLETPVGLLSGGNQQKVSIGKWLAADCEILIVDEPTIGVDVGAKAQIHQLIWELAARHGKSVIVISSDLPELVRLVNRLLVFREHRIVGEVTEIDAQRKSYADVSREIAPCFA